MLHLMPPIPAALVALALAGPAADTLRSVEPLAEAPGEERVAADPEAVPHGVWREIAPFDPIHRHGATLTFDPRRGRYVLFGGHDRGGHMNDVWIYTPDADPRWTRLDVAGPAPAPRQLHVAVFDDVNDRLLIHGGGRDYFPHLWPQLRDPFGDTWELRFEPQPAWRRLDTVGDALVARSAHGASLDARRAELVIAGGYDGARRLADLWTLDLRSGHWRRRLGLPSLVGGRFAAAGVVDTTRGEIIVVAGDVGPGSEYPDNHTWALPIAGEEQWRHLSTAGVLPVRRGHAAVHDAGRDRLVLFGGESPTRGAFVNDTWIMLLGEGSNWTRLVTPSTGTPPARSGHTLTFVPSFGPVLIAGSGTTLMNDVWVLNSLANPFWVRLGVGGTPPPPRREHSAIWDPVRRRILLFGGRGENGETDDVWELTVASSRTWRRLSPAGQGPGPRSGHVAAYDPLNDRMLIHGGRGPGGGLDDVWALSLSGTPTWSRLTAEGEQAPARWSHAGAYDPGTGEWTILCGTSDGVHARSDHWKLSIGVTVRARPVARDPGMSARMHFPIVADAARDRLIAFGGANGLTALGDLRVLDLATMRGWEPMAVSGEGPTPRWDALVVVDPAEDRLLLAMGRSLTAVEDDVWSLPLSGAPHWTRVAASGEAPRPLERSSGALDPVRGNLVIYGGRDEEPIDRGDVWTLDLRGEPVWSRIPGAPHITPDVGGPVAILDQAGDRILMLKWANGRYDPAGAPAVELWSRPLSDAGAWRRHEFGGAPPRNRSGASIVLDSRRSRLLVFGGKSSDPPFEPLDDLWALDLGERPTWTLLEAAGDVPRGLSRQYGAYDVSRDRIVVYGHTAAGSGVWELELGGIPTWRAVRSLERSHVVPTLAAVALDEARDRLLLFGGHDAPEGGRPALVELHLPPAQVHPREVAGDDVPGIGQRAAFDARGQRMLVFGTGGQGQDLVANPGAISTRGRTRWSRLTPTGRAPGARAWPFVVYDAKRSRVVMFGGGRGLDDRRDHWVLSFEEPAALAASRPRDDAAASFALAPPVPNPARGRTALAFTLEGAAPGSLEVFDVAGRRCFRDAWPSARRGRQSVDMDTGGWPPGVYVVRLVEGARIATARLAVIE